MRAAACDVDWDRFAEVLARHRIEGLAHEALTCAGAEPPAALAAGLRAAARTVAMEGLRLAAESARLQARLEAAGVGALILKGAPLEHLAWGRIGLKRAWDIDVLVAPPDAARARQVLEACGYDLADPPGASSAAFARWVALSKESVFRQRDGAMVVELHWRLIEAATLLPGLDVRSPSQTVEIAPGLRLRTLADAELFAYLSVHGASHGWSRLKWLADLAALLARRDEAGRARLFAQAEALGAGRCPSVALLLCERLFGLPLPASAAAAIRADHKAGRLARLALDILTAGGGRSEPADQALAEDRVRLAHFLFADGWPYLWAEFRRQWVSVDDHMRLPLPAGLGFVHGLIRAPSWIWRRIRRAAGGAVSRP